MRNSAVGYRSLLLGMVLWGCSALALGGPSLRIGIEGDYPPFSEVDADGRLVGFDVDIAEALCRQMKVDCVLVRQNWTRAIDDLNDGKIDALVSSMSITPERMKRVTFTRPYYNSPVRFVIRRDRDILVDPPVRLAGQTIAVEAGSIYEDFVRSVYVPLGAKILVLEGGAVAVWQALVDGRADTSLNDVVVNEAFLQSANGQDFVEVGPQLTDSRYLGAGAAIALAKGNLALATRFDQALLAIYRSGEYGVLRQRYFRYEIWPQ